MDQPYNIQDSVKQEYHYRVYKRRWYVLTMYSLYTFTQSVVWNTWGPISTTTEDAFGWHDSTIAWMNNWGPISYVLTGLFFPWLLHVKGLRWATVISMFSVAAGTACRVITSEPGTATILIHVGQFLNGVGGPISSGTIPAVSAIWFPPTERVTATALSNSVGTFGTALAFILGPALVSSAEAPSNKSSPPHHYFLFRNYDVESSMLEPANTTAPRVQEREEIMRYMYYVCGWAVVLFLVILCYFPAKPPHPPCISATVERQHYWRGLFSLGTNGYFMIVTFVYGISNGVFGAWTSVLNINLNTVAISEETAGWMGFYAVVAGCVGSLLVGRFADRMVRYIRLFILIMYVLTAAALTVFALMLVKIVPHSEVGLYATTIIASTAINIAVPLMFELASEMAYPTSEGTANGVLTLFSNFCGLVFLAVFSIPSIGTMWMNWTVIGSTAVCIPLLAILRGRFNRLEVDEGLHTERYAENVIVVPEEYSAEDPLLAHENGQPVMCARNDVITSDYYGYGIQNPVVATHAAMLSESNPYLNIPEFYGIQNPAATPAVRPSSADLNLTIAEQYGIQNPVAPHLGMPPSSDLDLSIPEQYGIQNPVVKHDAMFSPVNSDLTIPEYHGIPNSICTNNTAMPTDADIDLRTSKQCGITDSLLDNEYD